MRVFLGIVTFLIIYGSLYPFYFKFNTIQIDTLKLLFDFNVFHSSFSDSISNIFLFIPFGFLLAKIIPNELKYKALIILTISFVFAYLVQVVQLLTPDRIPSGADAVLNTIGAYIGIFISYFSFKKIVYINQIKYDEAVVPFILAMALILLNISPFVPAIDFHVFKQSIKLLFDYPSIDMFWVFENTVLWLITFFFLKLARFPKQNILFLCSIVLAMLILKLFIQGGVLTYDHIMGGAIALSLWFFYRDKIKAVHLTFGLIAMLVGLALYPFEFSSVVSSFHWLPFEGSLNGNILINIIALTKKVVIYSTLVYLAFLSIHSLVKATIASALLLLLLEYSQIFFTNSVAEISDAILVLFTGYFIHLIQNNTIKHRSQIKSKNENVNAAKVLLDEPSFIQEENTTHKISGVNGLRALAAMSVFMVHYNQQVTVSWDLGYFELGRLLENGNTGVGLFFILSGFLLALPFWNAKIENKDSPNIKGYLIRRAARIIPAYYFCLFGIIFIKVISGASLNFNNVISHLFFVHNFKDYQVMSFNPPFWTLAVEMQFYIFLPLFFFLTRKLSVRNTLMIAIGLIPGIYLLYVSIMQWLIELNSWPISIPLIWPFGFQFDSATSAALKYATTAHLPHFLLGVFTAFCFLKAKKWRHYYQLNNVIFFVTLSVILLILASPLDGLLQLEYGRYNFPFIPILLAILIFTAPMATAALSFLELKVVSWIGVISYGIYIYHYPVLKVTKRIMEAGSYDINYNSWLYWGISILVTVFVAHLSFIFIEQPVVRRVKKRSRETRGFHLKESNIQYKVKKTSSIKLPENVYIISATLVAVFVSFFIINSQPRVIITPSWAHKDANIIFDHHTHSNFSDGELSVDDLVEMAYIGGCNAVAITDHSLNNSVNEQKINQIILLRQQYPSMRIFTGIELGMPSYEGREHVNLLMHPKNEKEFLLGIMEQLKNLENVDKNKRDEYLISKLNKLYKINEKTVGIYNHPSRKDKTSSENENDISVWNKTGLFVDSFSGAPGHQRIRDQIGYYKTNFKTIDRWDPVVANVNGTWDKLLSKGENIYGAIASSDFHNYKMDELPCDFARIHITTEEESYDAILKSLKQGTYWADHGNILNQFKFSVSVEESDSVFPGATITASINEIANVTIQISRAEGSIGKPLIAEVISNCLSSKSELVTTKFLPPNKSRVDLVIPLLTKGADGQSCYFRSRIKLDNPFTEDLLAISNHIRILMN